MLAFCFASPWNEGQAKIQARGSKISPLSRSRLKCLLLLTGWAQLSLLCEKTGGKQTAGKSCFHKWSQCPAGAEDDLKRYTALHGRFLVFSWDRSEELYSKKCKSQRKETKYWHYNTVQNIDIKSKETGERRGKVWRKLSGFWYNFSALLLDPESVFWKAAYNSKLIQRNTQFGSSALSQRMLIWVEMEIRMLYLLAGHWVNTLDQWFPSWHISLETLQTQLSWK